MIDNKQLSISTQLRINDIVNLDSFTYVYGNIFESHEFIMIGRTYTLV